MCFLLLTEASFPGDLFKATILTQTCLHANYIPYFQSPEDGKCFLLWQSQAQRVNPNIRPSDVGTRQIPCVHGKRLLRSFSGSLIYSVGRVINNSVVLGEIQLPAMINVSPEVRDEGKKRLGNPCNSPRFIFIRPLSMLSAYYEGI